MQHTLVALFVAGCNFGSQSLIPADSPAGGRDAPSTETDDAVRVTDARVMHDAFVMPDAVLADAKVVPDAAVFDAPLADSFFPDASKVLDNRLSYTWDDRRVLCSKPVDDLSNPVDWNRVEEQFLQAEQNNWVALVHAHKPGITISVDAITRILTMADAHHLDYVRFDQLSAGPPRPGLGFSIDDDDVDGWFTILQPLLAAHGAHVTFFVTRWPGLDQTRLAELATLAADGHDLEAHSIVHVDAALYVAANSLDAYITDQVVPSIDIMVAAGYHPTSFAFPFGSTTPEISAAVLQHVARVRTTPGPCPNLL